ncbi:MAG: GatB/YqeY domain-containing protein [Peptococcaceae bacterium]
MSLNQRLLDDMKGAMKEREAGKLKLSVIRMVRAAIKNVEINSRKELNDEEIIEVIAREVKQRRDSIPEYEKANRQDIVESLQAEINILLDYLPRQLTEDDIRALVRNVIEEVGAASSRDIGKVMGKLMPQVKGKADGKLVNQVVNSMLK